MGTRSLRWRGAIAGATALALLWGCGGDDASSTGGSAAAETTTGAAGTTSAATSQPSTSGPAGSGDGALMSSGYLGDSDDADPVSGGHLDFAVFSSPLTLDPARQPDSGLASTELAAIYDALMRFDPERGEYVPWQAQSLEPNADFTEWTLTLRPDITFSDGTPLDSAAVVLQMQRTQALRKGNYTDIVESMDTPDPLTVVYRLREGWAGFPYALAVNPGRIPSPTAVAAAGDEYGPDPVGAGAFILERWAPGEEMIVAARDDYWAGRPPLDTIRFAVLPDDSTRLDSLQTGGIDGGFLRLPSAVHDAVDSGIGGYLNVLNAGEVLVINNGLGGADTPGSDVRIRQAIALALDTDRLNETVNGGEGLWSKDAFGSTSPLHGTVTAPPTDPAAATALVDAAKADGFDGGITLTCDGAPERQRLAIAIQAQLKVVGIDVTIDSVASVTDTIRKVFAERSFEIACYGYSWQDIAPFVGASLLQSGPANALGFGEPSVDAAIDALRQAATLDDTIAGIDLLQQGFNDYQPFVPLAAVRELVAWNDNVHGVTVSAFTVPDFTKAWVSA